MKNLKDFRLNETILCEGWVEWVDNPQTNSLKVNVQIKTKELKGQLITFVNHNHPLFNYLKSGESRFYARVQAIVTGQYNEQYQNLKVNLLQIEPIAYMEQQIVNIEDLVKRLKAHLKTFKNKELYALCRSVLVSDEEFRNKVFHAPSHEKQAYCYRGGLLQHIVRLMDMTDRLVPILAQNYFLDYRPEEIDSDLIKTAALFHDLGVAKALEVTEKDEVKRTFEGDIIGSSAMSIEILTKMLMLNPLSNPYLEINLRGIIASSKADIEENSGNGSKILPKTKEAYLFANLERIEFHDARFQALERELTEPEMVRRFGSLYVVPNQGDGSEVEMISPISSNPSTSIVQSEEVVPTPSEEVLTPLEPMSPMTLEESSMNEVETSDSMTPTTEELSFINPIEPTNTLTPLPEGEVIDSIISEVALFDETPSDQPLNLINEEPTVSESSLPQAANNPVINPYGSSLPIYDQSNGLNPYDNQGSNQPEFNPYAHSNMGCNPYTQPVDPESGMPIESMYSMDYVEGVPLDIPSTWPETPNTRPNIKE